MRVGLERLLGLDEVRERLWHVVIEKVAHSLQPFHEGIGVVVEVAIPLLHLISMID